MAETVIDSLCSLLQIRRLDTNSEKKKKTFASPFLDVMNTLQMPHTFIDNDKQIHFNR